MTIFKSSEYTCLRICNNDDTKVIDWICTIKTTHSTESNKHCTKTENKKHTAQKRENNTNNDEITKAYERRLKIYENTYLTKIEKEKAFWRGDFESKLTLNHPSYILLKIIQMIKKY